MVGSKEIEMTFKLWGRPTSARTEKVMLALAELNIEHDYILSSDFCSYFIC